MVNTTTTKNFTPLEAMAAFRSKVKVFEDMEVRAAAPELPWHKPWQWWTAHERYCAKFLRSELKRNAKNAAEAAKVKAAVEARIAKVQAAVEARAAKAAKAAKERAVKKPRTTAASVLVGAVESMESVDAVDAAEECLEGPWMRKMGRGISVEELCNDVERGMEYEMNEPLPQLDGGDEDDYETFWPEGKALTEALKVELLSSGECCGRFHLTGACLDVRDVLDYKTGMPLPAYKVIACCICLLLTFTDYMCLLLRVGGGRWPGPRPASREHHPVCA